MTRSQRSAPKVGIIYLVDYRRYSGRRRGNKSHNAKFCVPPKSPLLCQRRILFNTNVLELNANEHLSCRAFFEVLALGGRVPRQ